MSQSAFLFMYSVVSGRKRIYELTPHLAFYFDSGSRGAENIGGDSQMTEIEKWIYAGYTVFIIALILAGMWREAGREVAGE